MCGISDKCLSEANVMIDYEQIIAPFHFCANAPFHFGKRYSDLMSQFVRPNSLNMKQFYKRNGFCVVLVKSDTGKAPVIESVIN